MSQSPLQYDDESEDQEEDSGQQANGGRVRQYPDLPSFPFNYPEETKEDVYEDENTPLLDKKDSDSNGKPDPNDRSFSPSPRAVPGRTVRQSRPDQSACYPGGAKEDDVSGDNQVDTDAPALHDPQRRPSETSAANDEFVDIDLSDEPTNQDQSKSASKPLSRRPADEEGPPFQSAFGWMYEFILGVISLAWAAWRRLRRFF